MTVGANSARDRPRIRLFVAGESPSSVAAKDVLRQYLPLDARHCELIDVLRDPARALEAGLIATPTLVLEEDGRERRYVGDLREQPELHHYLQSLASSGKARR